MTGSVVMSKVDARLFVVLGKPEKHMPYGEIVGITVHITL
jgi:hypothetical protein